MKKILLTGSTGFLGSAILHKIHKDNFIYLVSRKKTKKIRIKKNTNEIYFKDFKQLNSKLKKIKADTIIHCATHYVKAHGESDISKLSNANIVLGNILLDNLENLSVKNFINFSTVWENYDGKKDNCYNLYSAYKAGFGKIISFYKKENKNIKFLNLVISDTFGLRDKRKKLVNLLKTNYKRNLVTKIISKNLYINLLNVKDIVSAIKLILKKNYKSDTYILKNKNNFKIHDIVKKIEKYSKKKIKVKWISNKIIKEKIYKFKTLKGWKPKNSDIKDIVRIITE